MILEEERTQMTGADLIKIIQSNSYLQYAPLKYTIAYLLKNRLINPSTLIDEQVHNLEDTMDKYKCHFVEADTCNHLFMEGNKEQKEFAKKRAMYNGQFNPCFPKNNKMDANTIEECREWFKNIYGFNPEEA